MILPLRRSWGCVLLGLSTFSLGQMFIISVSTPLRTEQNMFFYVLLTPWAEQWLFQLFMAKCTSFVRLKLYICFTITTVLSKSTVSLYTHATFFSVNSRRAKEHKKKNVFSIFTERWDFLSQHTDHRHCWVQSGWVGRGAGLQLSAVCVICLWMYEHVGLFPLDHGSYHQPAIGLMQIGVLHRL